MNFHRSKIIAGGAALGLALLAHWCTCLAQPPFPIGNDALRLFDDWPLYREGVVCLQASSADPLGGDADGSGYLPSDDTVKRLRPQD